MPGQATDNGIVSEIEKSSWPYEKVNTNGIKLFNVKEVKDIPKFDHLKNFKNLDEYEIEKIETSLRELKSVAETMQRYMDTMKDLEEKGIWVQGVQHAFDKLRFQDALFGSEGEFRKVVAMQHQMALVLDKIDNLQKTE